MNRRRINNQQIFNRGIEYVYSERHTLIAASIITAISNLLGSQQFAVLVIGFVIGYMAKAFVLQLEQEQDSST